MDLNIPKTSDITFRKVHLDVCRLHPKEQSAPLTPHEIDLVALFKREDEAFGVVVLHPTGNPYAPYEVISGKPIVKAARIAGLEEIHAFVGEIDKAFHDILNIPLDESNKRSNKIDKDPLEEAMDYQQFMKTFKLSERSAAHRLKISRNTLSKSLALLTLNPIVQGMISEGKLDKTYGRILARVGDKGVQLRLAEAVINAGGKISTRALDDHIAGRRHLNILAPRKKDPNLIELENQLTELLGCNVTIQGVTRTQGKILITTLDQEMLLDMLFRVNCYRSRSLHLSVSFSDKQTNKATFTIGYGNNEDFSEALLRLGFRREGE